MGKYLRIYSYIRKPFLIYDFAPAPCTLNFLIYEENLIFFFSVCIPIDGTGQTGPHVIHIIILCFFH
jgi:hypothetical protein